MAIESNHHEADKAGGAWRRPAFNTRPSAGGVALTTKARAAQAAALWLPGVGPLVVLPDAAAATPRLHRDARPAAGSSLVPWLALWLAREGVCVLVHGPGAAQGGGGAAEVLHSLGIGAAGQVNDITDRWARREPAVIPSSLLAPGLAPAGIAWRLAAPQGRRPCLRVVPCDAPGSERHAAAWAARSGEAALLLAGAPVADPRHCPRVEVWIGGKHRTELGTAAADEPPAHWTPMPRATSAAATALFVQEMLSGERPTPGPLRRLARLVERALAAVTSDRANKPDSCL